MIQDNIYQCFSPVSFKNKYTGEIMTAKCGHCSACLKSKQNDLIKRLTLEYRSFAHCIFFTLTYSDDFLPTVLDEETGEIMMSARRVDITLFIKRLRKYLQMYVESLEKEFIKQLYSNLNFKDYERIKQEIKKAKIRYFCASEYGKQRGRPHYHGLLFTDSDFFAKNAYSFIHKAWKSGFANASPAGRKSIQYVAKYCTSSLLQSNSHSSSSETNFKESFSAKSKQISSRYFEESFNQTREIVTKGIVQYIYEKENGSTLSLLPSSFERKWFPRCRQFTLLSHKDKLRNYLEYFKGEKPKLIDFNNLSEPKKLFDVAYRDWLVSQKFVNNANYLSLSFDKYLQCIEYYYSNKDMFMLNNFFRSQENYSKNNDYRYLNNLYSDVVYFAHRSHPLPYSIGDISLSEFSNTFWFSHDKKFTEFVNETNHFIRDSLKTKVLNDQLDLLTP